MVYLSRLQTWKIECEGVVGSVEKLSMETTFRHKWFYYTYNAGHPFRIQQVQVWRYYRGVFLKYPGTIC